MSKEVEPVKISSKEQKADVLTKALDNDKLIIINPITST